MHNLGRAGETVEGLLSRMGRELEGWPAPDYVFIMSGANNVAMEETGFITEYRDIIKQFRAKAPDAKIFVHSLIPMLLPWVTPEMITNVNGLLQKVAEETGAEYLDIHGLFVDSGVRDCLLEDGVHVSEDGYDIWSAKVEEVIEG